MLLWFSGTGYISHSTVPIGWRIGMYQLLMSIIRNRTNWVIIIIIHKQWHDNGQWKYNSNANYSSYITFLLLQYRPNLLACYSKTEARRAISCDKIIWSTLGNQQSYSHVYFALHGLLSQCIYCDNACQTLILLSSTGFNVFVCWHIL